MKEPSRFLRGLAAGGIGPPSSLQTRSRLGLHLHDILRLLAIEISLELLKLIALQGTPLFHAKLLGEPATGELQFAQLSLLNGLWGWIMVSNFPLVYKELPATVDASRGKLTDSYLLYRLFHCISHNCDFSRLVQTEEPADGLLLGRRVPLWLENVDPVCHRQAVQPIGPCTVRPPAASAKVI